MLLIGDSGVGKSCLLLRFAVSFLPGWNSHIRRAHTCSSGYDVSSPKPSGGQVRRGLFIHDRSGFCTWSCILALIVQPQPDKACRSHRRIERLTWTERKSNFSWYVSVYVCQRNTADQSCLPLALFAVGYCWARAISNNH